MKIYYKFFILLNLIALIGYSQENKTKNRFIFSGQIIDKNDGKPLSFASVVLANTNRGIATDQNGYFEFDRLLAGDISLIVSHVGCKTDTFNFTISADVFHTIYMDHQDYQMDEVEVVAYKLPLVELDENCVICYWPSNEDIKSMAVRSISDISNTVIGVEMLSTGSNVSKPMIQGLHSNRVAMVNNGIVMESQSWGEDHAPEIDPFTTDEMIVYKGASALKYSSSAIGGVVISNPKPLMDTIGINGQFNLAGATNNRKGIAALRLEGKFKGLKNFSWAIQSSVKKSGNIKTPNYYLKNTGTEELNYSWNIGYKKNRFSTEVYYSQFNTEIGIFSGAHVGNLSDLNDIIQSGQPKVEDLSGFSYEINRPKQIAEHELIKWQTNYDLKSKGEIELILSRQFNIRKEFDKHFIRGIDESEKSKAEFSVNLENYSANINWNFSPVFNRIFIELGGIYNNSKNRLKGVRDFIPNYDANSVASYFNGSYLYKFFKLEFGGRLDFLQNDIYQLNNNQLEVIQKDFNTAAYTIGLSYRKIAYTNLFINFASAQRAPAINEMFSSGLHHGLASLEYGNENLQSEQSNNFSLGGNFNYKKLNAKLLLYNNHINDFIYLKPNGTALTVKGAFPVYEYQQTEAVIRGIDADFTYEFIDNLSYKYTMSFIWANNITDNEFLYFMPPKRISNQLNYQFKTIGKIIQPRIGLRLNSIFKQNRVVENQELAPPPAGYNLLNFSAAFSFKINNQTADLTLDISNASNQVYRNYLNRLRYYSDEEGINVLFNLRIPFTIN